MKTVKVFLNHAKEDRGLVRNLYTELKKQSWIDPWLDEENLLPGQDWRLEIGKAMEQADAFLICLSRVSIQKTGYVQAEIRKAQDQQDLRPRGAIYMIPVLLEDCRVPDHLKDYHWVDLSQPDGMEKLMKSLETLK